MLVSAIWILAVGRYVEEDGTPVSYRRYAQLCNNFKIGVKQILLGTTRRQTTEQTGWKWQEASLTSNQTKLNKTFPLRQRPGKTGTILEAENFSSLSFSSACPTLKARFLQNTDKL